MHNVQKVDKKMVYLACLYTFMHGIQETISTLYISPKYCLVLRLTAIVGLIRMDKCIFGWLERLLRAALFFILTCITLDSTWEIC